MGWFKRRASVNAEQLRRVVNLIPEYVDALIEERMGARAKVEGLDGRELHGPAERKLKKIEARIAELVGGEPRNTPNTRNGLTGQQQRKIFIGALPGAILTDEQRGAAGIV